jgi:fumarylacetoacetase
LQNPGLIKKDSHFPIQNIPFGVASRTNDPRSRKFGCTAIGDFVLDLSLVYEAGLLADTGLLNNAFLNQNGLNDFMEYPSPVWSLVRNRIISLLVDGTFCNTIANDGLRKYPSLQSNALIPKEQVTMHLPAKITEYTDFYSSREHATNMGIMYRGVDNALQPNWLHLPVGYHGRASSVVVNGTPVKRPCGQVQKTPGEPKDGSVFTACNALDFELEIGCFLGTFGSPCDTFSLSLSFSFLGGPANSLGSPVTMDEAENRILVLFY